MDADVSWLNQLWKEICQNKGVNFLKVDMKFEDRNTWKRGDPIHLSLDSCGLPKYFDAIITHSMKPGKYNMKRPMINNRLLLLIM